MARTGTKRTITRGRILRAARWCFSKLGVENASIIDVSNAAELSRSLIYKYFPDKQAIIDAITIEEMYQIHAQVIAKVKSVRGYRERLVEGVLQGAAFSANNYYIQLFLTGDSSWLRSKMDENPVREISRELWFPFLHQGVLNGELRATLDVARAVDWISMCQAILQLRFDWTAVDEREVREYVREFIIQPLIANESHCKSK